MNNPLPLSSSLSQHPRNDPTVVYPLGHVPPNFIAIIHGNASSTSSTFFKNSNNGIAPNTSNNGNALINNRNAPLPPPLVVFCDFKKKIIKKEKKTRKTKIKSTNLLCSFRSPIFVQNLSFYFTQSCFWLFFGTFLIAGSIELFQPEAFTRNDLRRPNVSFKPRTARRNNKKAVAVYQSANKHFASESVENVRANKSMRLSIDFKHSHYLSLRLDDRKGSSRVSTRLNDVLLTN